MQAEKVSSLRESKEVRKHQANRREILFRTNVSCTSNRRKLFINFNFNSSCDKPGSKKKTFVHNKLKKNRQQRLEDSEEDYEQKTKRVKHKKQVEDDPYIADDEDEDYNSKRRRSVNDEKNNLVMKVVKQGDYQHKQSFDRSSGGLGDIEQDFFLPRNLTPFSSSTSQISLKSGSKTRRPLNEEPSLENNSDFDEDYEDDYGNSTKTIERARVKAVFEMPRKPLPNYSKWSRWSKCSPKCVTRRYKKCRPHSRQTCGNDIIREIAYCYTEGSFCEEWISSQMSKIGAIEASKGTTTTKAPRTSRRTESPLTNSVSQNFYGSGSRRKNKMNLDMKPQNFQCGFPSIRNKNSDFSLKIIGGKTSRRAQVRNF